MIPRKQSKYKEFSSVARHKISIQSKTCSVDGAGGTVETWVDKYPNISAFVAPYFADQQWRYRSVGVDCTHMIKIRGIFLVSIKDRIYFKGRILEILTIEDLQEINFIKEIFCRELSE